MTDAVPSGWRNLVDWQRLVAAPLNKISQGYPFPSWDAEPADTNEGYMFYDTTDHAPKWFDGAAFERFNPLAALGDPGADRMLFWDDSAGAFAYLTPGTGLAISGTSLNASGGWTQIATSTPTGVSTVTFSSIPNTYSDLMVTVEGVSHNNGSTRYLTVAFSANGSSFTSGAITNDIGAASSAALYGKVFIPGYWTSAGVAIAATAALSSPGLYETGEFIRTTLATRVTGGISAIRFGWSGAGDFDAGTFTLYGK